MEEIEFDSRRGLEAQGFKEIADCVWAKGKTIYAQCRECKMFQKLLFPAIREKKVFFNCECNPDAISKFAIPLRVLKW